MAQRELVLAVACSVLACRSKAEDSPVRTQPPSPPPPVADAAPPPPPPVDADTEHAPVVIPETAPARRLWTHELPDAETFEAYSKELGGERFAKFAIDLKTDAVYYFDVDVYKVHKDFIFQELYKKPRTRAAVRLFDRNYTANKVDFMLCYLVHHTSQDVWTLAFWDGDRATSAHVARAYRRMKETFYLGDRVKFRPDSSYQERVAKQLVEVPFILNDQLYQAATYQAFNEGVAVGRLRVVAPDADVGSLTFAPDEIVVLAAPLPDITPVAGIIAEQFSTPLSHVSLRARAWGIPNVGLRDARALHGALDGKQVWFEARGGTYTLRPATPAEVAAHAAKLHPAVEIPAADPSITTLATLDAMGERDVVAYGAKAANLGEIVSAKLPGFEVPPGFAVPFHYYLAHLRAHGLDAKLAAMLADPAFVQSAAVRKRRLAALRRAIAEAPVADALRAEVATALAALPGSEGGVFVRSSGNAEDLRGFNGAGLYDSVPNQRGVDAVVASIARVWGSTWNHAAFEDRQRARIDPQRVASAVLVQVGVPATAAGVLVTRHPTDPTDEKNYTINAKSGLGMAVVDGRKVPESLIVSWYNHGIRILSRSAEDTKLVFDPKGGVREITNPDKGKPVLTNAMAIRLADSARELTKLFRNPRLDVEWVFVGTQLYVVQTRPLVGD